MRKPKIFACGALFPLSFGLFTSYKSQKNRLRRCDVSFVHLYKRSVDKQKLRKLERAAGGFFVYASDRSHPRDPPSGGTPKIWVARLLSRLELHMNDDCR